MSRITHSILCTLFCLTLAGCSHTSFEDPAYGTWEYNMQNEHPNLVYTNMSGEKSTDSMQRPVSLVTPQSLPNVSMDYGPYANPQTAAQTPVLYMHISPIIMIMTTKAKSYYRANMSVRRRMKQENGASFLWMA